jgi:hypothetical protein
VETYRSAVTVISSRPDASFAVVAAAASVAAGEPRETPVRNTAPRRLPHNIDIFEPE